MSATRETPILLISAVATHAYAEGSDFGWGILYENEDGAVNTITLWSSTGDLKVFKAIDEGKSMIVWTKVEVKGPFGGHKGYKWQVKEVLIRRDIMSGGVQ